MREAETGRTVQLLDLLATFFANEAHWTRGRYHDGWERRCLVGAVIHLSGKHHLAREPVMRVLQDALPRRGSGLVQFNDHECRDIDELRAVIARARALVNEDAERERAGEAVRRWLLAEIEKERSARAAAGDYRETYVLCPRVADDPATMPARLAA